MYHVAVFARVVRHLAPRRVTATLRASAVLAMVVVAAELTAQQAGAPPRFSSQIQLVEIYATVATADGEPVTGLCLEDFEVYEDD